MANRQIFQLTAKTLVSTDVFPVQDESGSAEAKKVTLQNIVDAVPADGTKLNVTTFNTFVSDFDTYSGATETEIGNKLDSVVGGTDIGIDNTDPNNPIINFTGSSGGGTWGSITGTLSDQTDLQTALDDKTDQSVFTGYTATTDTTLTNLNTGITANTASLLTKADKNLSVVSITGNYTLTEGDNGKVIQASGTGTFTFPDGLSNGWQVIINNTGTGVITLAATTTLNTKDGNTKISSQYAGVTAYHQSSNIFFAFGDLTA